MLEKKLELKPKWYIRLGFFLLGCAGAVFVLLAFLVVVVLLAAMGVLAIIIGLPTLGFFYPEIIE